ncbi:leucine-rich repeat flightless-interacting protein 1 isoform X21 [Cervus canadensis]|uniref:leucine-rich repeat flightless-interacting protein 1 isoform X21 n=1 Tax=Cervus canadensis TaxID=1574408 RepID=UPI001C9E4361|nr:leucine-rich repeat flightless-interacting protein 1 isoform X21 [Cervus canadensis]
MTNPAAAQNQEIDCLSPEAQRLAEARLAAKRAARAEAREIRMKELERQQKEIYQVQKKYYGLDTKWGDIEQWMEDSERYSHRSRRNTSASDEDERMSVGSRGSLRSQPDLEYGGPYAWTNGYDGDLYGSQSLSRRSGRNSSYSGDSRFSTLSSSREDTLGLSCSDLGLRSRGLAPKPLSAQNGNRPSYLYSAARPAGSNRASVSDESSLGGARRGSACGSQALGGQASELSGHFKSSSRASSRASSARASPVVEERPEKDFTEKGSRSLPGLSAATLASLGGTSSRRGSGDTSISIDTEASIREIKELNELKDQIQDVEGKYMQGLKEMKDSLAEVEEKYKKAMVSNAQLDNEKTNFMYQVDTLKDMLLELEEQLAESRRQYEEKSKEFEREKHAHSILQFQFAEVKEALKQREEMLEKHGIILNSEIATNGEMPDTLNSIALQTSTKMTKEELNALQATGDGTLGRANEVEVKNEMVEHEGKREILQNSEQRQHKEDPGEDCVDTEVLHPGDNAEDQKTSEDSAPSPGTLVSSENEEQGQSQILENSASFPADTQQVESSEVINSELVGEIPDPGIGRGSGNALDIENQREESAQEQEKGKQEDLKTTLGEMSTKPCQESAPPQISEAEQESSADPSKQSGSPTKAEPEAGLTGLGEQGGGAASGPLSGSDDPGSHHEKCLVDAPEGSDPSAGQDVEKELANQEVAEPREAPVQSTEAGGENKEEEEDEGRNLREVKPIELEVQTSPCSPKAESSPQEVTDPRVEDAESEPLDVKDPNEENDQQGEALDLSQKKTKSKKKKNKKKKSPAPAEIKDVQKELTFQNPDLSEVKEEQGKITNEEPVVNAQNEVSKTPKQNSVAEGSENSDGPENPEVELDGKLNQDDAAVNTKADGDTLDFEDNMIQSSGTNKELDECAVKDEAEEDGRAPSGPPGPENIEVPSSALLEDGSPAKDTNDASQTEGTEGHVMPESLDQTVREFSDSVHLENDGLAAADEAGDFNSESKEEKTGGTGKGRNKEDCTMS